MVQWGEKMSNDARKIPMIESVFVPIRWRADVLWSNPIEQSQYDKKAQRAQRRENVLKKSGLTLSEKIEETTIGLIVYEIHCWRNVAAIDQLADAVLDGLQAGRLKL